MNESTVKTTWTYAADDNIKKTSRICQDQNENVCARVVAAGVPCVRAPSCQCKNITRSCIPFHSHTIEAAGCHFNRAHSIHSDSPIPIRTHQFHLLFIYKFYNLEKQQQCSRTTTTATTAKTEKRLVHAIHKLSQFDSSTQIFRVCCSSKDDVDVKRIEKKKFK